MDENDLFEVGFSNSSSSKAASQNPRVAVLAEGVLQLDANKVQARHAWKVRHAWVMHPASPYWATGIPRASRCWKPCERCSISSMKTTVVTICPCNPCLAHQQIQGSSLVLWTCKIILEPSIIVLRALSSTNVRPVVVDAREN